MIEFQIKDNTKNDVDKVSKKWIGIAESDPTDDIIIFGQKMEFVFGNEKENNDNNNTQNEFENNKTKKENNKQMADLNQKVKEQYIVYSFNVKRKDNRKKESK